MTPSLQSSKEFVLEQARLNIERVVRDPGYVQQAKQVNSSLASIVAAERNEVMREAIKFARDKNQLGNVHDV